MQQGSRASGGAVMLMLALGSSAAFAQSQNAAGDPARGKALYYAHACYSCHGYNGETGARDL
ncbi:MAG TPA: c-type cytochrome, partial [Gammaproteobacteria bacterium]|nr:c-type cytochrome [Gammaproteobacteria bacterium]